MSSVPQAIIDHYEALYETDDVFHQQNRRYGAFMAAIVGRAGVAAGATVLDAGCGQGYLSRHLAACGMKVWCCDLSRAGIRSIARDSAALRGRGVVADLLRPPFDSQFDLVFQRSCSLFNSAPSAMHGDVVDRLTDCAKVGGRICVVYNSNVTAAGNGWFNHTLSTLRPAFANPRLSDIRIYAVNKVDTAILGRYGFNSVITRTNVFISRAMRRSVEIVIFATRRT